MSDLHKLFLEKSGLTLDEANEFLKMKYDEAFPPKEPDAKQIAANEKLAKEAREWKRKHA
jgi:hypothetical protein